MCFGAQNYGNFEQTNRIRTNNPKNIIFFAHLYAFKMGNLNFFFKNELTFLILKNSTFNVGFYRKYLHTKSNFEKI
jgi:hypothetical protein